MPAAFVLAALALGQSQLAPDAYMRSLAIAGNVQTENGYVADPGLDANTKFQLGVEAKWSYNYSFSRQGQSYFSVITPRFLKLEVTVKHMLRLPTYESSDTPRFTTLLLHEYDHVAVSTDERPRTLLKGLIQRIGAIRKPWGGPTPPPSNVVDRWIGAEVEARKNAVVSLMNDAYKRLDQESEHGRKPIASRESLFSALYGLEHMKQAKFEYLAQAEEIAQSPEFVGAKRYYRS